MPQPYKSEENSQENLPIRNYLQDIGYKYKHFIPEFNKYVIGEDNTFRHIDTTEDSKGILVPKYSVANKNLEHSDIWKNIHPFTQSLLLLGRALLDKLLVRVGVYISSGAVLLYTSKFFSPPYPDEPLIIGTGHSFEDFRPADRIAIGKHYYVKPWTGTEYKYPEFFMGNPIIEDFPVGGYVYSPIFERYLRTAKFSDINWESTLRDRPEPIFSPIVDVNRIQISENRVLSSQYNTIYPDKSITKSEEEINTEIVEYEKHNYAGENWKNPETIVWKLVARRESPQTEIFKTWKKKSVRTITGTEQDGEGKDYIWYTKTVITYELETVGYRNYMKYVYFYLSDGQLIYRGARAGMKSWASSIEAQFADIVVDVDKLISEAADISEIEYYPWVFDPIILT